MAMIHETGDPFNGPAGHEFTSLGAVSEKAAAFVRGRFLYGRGNPIIKGDILLI
jgi:hypothetical protein